MNVPSDEVDQQDRLKQWVEGASHIEQRGEQRPHAEGHQVGAAGCYSNHRTLYRQPEVEDPCCTDVRDIQAAKRDRNQTARSSG